MSVSAAQVKELRERTGAGMMECKKALEITKGDIKLAIEELRKSGIAKADKKSGRIAAEGVIIVRLSDDTKQAVLIEINSETDFVARDENFLKFTNAVADVALQNQANSIETLSNLPFTNTSIEEARQALVAKVGENIHLRRIEFQESPHHIGSYLHGNRIGVLVKLDVDNAELAKDIAMHVAASKPLFIAPEDVSSEMVAKEKEIYMAQASGSGKPQEIIEKMVAGRIKKYLDEVSLLGQPFVKDPNITIAALLSKHRAKVVAFTRFEVGEGIEKETEDFREAVMSQVQGSG
ncbi:MAG TPA: translation elongation factor Ts [Gammaproteobacteria bacterium]|jgi:elongation factor Ts|nr:translation elongation factor Ts [Gammaproteobacteria bacterium]